MREMQAGKFHLAIVADEYGGDRRPDHAGGLPRGAGRRDRRRVRHRGRRRRSGCPTATTSSTAACRSRSSTSCSTSTLPDEDWDTVGGFLFGTLEHVPERGEVVESRRLAVHRRGGRRPADPARADQRVRRRRRRCRRAAAEVDDGGVRLRVQLNDAGGYVRRPWRSRWTARSRSSPARRRASARRSPRGSPTSGAKVMLSSRKQDQLEAAAAEIAHRAGGRPPCSPPTPATSTPPRRASAATIERFGGLDILVNNAGDQPVLRGDARRRPGAVRQDVRGQPARAAVLVRSRPGSRRSRTQPGVIINIASVGGLRAEFGLGVYNVTKAALIHLTRQLAGELGPTRVVGIAPGLVKTDFAAVLVENFGERARQRSCRPSASASRRTSPTWPCSWPATRPAGSPARPTSSTAAPASAAASSSPTPVLGGLRSIPRSGRRAVRWQRFRPPRMRSQRAVTDGCDTPCS